MARVKTPKAVITFPNTFAAMAFEELAARENLPGRLIPVPSALSAGCGLAWCATEENRAALEAALAQHAPDYEGVHTVELY